MKIKHQLIAGALLATFSSPTMAQTLVGVSWSDFGEERWKTDEAAIKRQLVAAGGAYVSADAGGSAAKQLADIDGLIAKGAKVLIILAVDKDAVLPAVASARTKHIPVIAYDRLIEAPGVFYITFDNKEVGRMTARAVLAAKPKGNYAFIKGSPTDPNANFLREGQGEVLADAVKKGDIKIVGDEYTDGWKPEIAQKNMEKILTKNSNKVDAVIASNDGMAGGVLAALAAHGLTGIPVSGQDADRAAINRVALGTQTVTVWKDSRELGREAATAAVAMGAGRPVDGSVMWKSGAKEVPVKAMFIKATPITSANLDTVIKGGWITKEAACRGVETAKAPVACR